MRAKTIPRLVGLLLLCLYAASCSDASVSVYASDGDSEGEQDAGHEIEAIDGDPESPLPDGDAEADAGESDYERDTASETVETDTEQEPESEESISEGETEAPENDTETETEADVEHDSDEDPDSSVVNQWESIHPPSRLNADLFAAVIPPGGGDWIAFGDSIASSDDRGANWQVLTERSLPRQVTRYYDNFDCAFISPDTAFFATGNELFKTTNRGNSWEPALTLEQTHPSYTESAVIHALDFSGLRVGYLVGGFDRIMKTADGGGHWTTLRSNDSTTPYRSYSDVVFLSEQVGFVAGYQVPDIGMNFGFGHFVMKTTDGGEHWETHTFDPVGDYRGLDLRIVDEQTLFVRLYRTQSIEKVFGSADGGATWSEVSATSDLEDIEAMYWLDGERGLLFGTDATTRQAGLFRTGNHGLDWIRVALPFNGPLDERSILDMAFTDDRKGFATGQGGTIFTTSNGGSSWELANQGYPEFYSIAFGTDDLGLMSTGLGYYHSDDGGTTWNYVTGNESVYVSRMSTGPQGTYLAGVMGECARVDPDTNIAHRVSLPVSFMWLYYVGQSEDALFLAGTVTSPTRYNAFLISTDQGEHFDVHEIDAGENGLIDIEYRSGVFFATTTGGLLVSPDNGATWHNRHVFSPDIAGHTEFFDDATGVAALADGHLLRTEDQGVSWVTVSEENRNISGLFAADDRTLFACGQKKTGYGWVGTIWRSDDRGMSWEEDTLPVRVEGQIKSMCASEHYVFAIGGNGEVLRLRKPAVSGDE